MMRRRFFARHHIPNANIHFRSLNFKDGSVPLSGALPGEIQGRIITYSTIRERSRARGAGSTKLHRHHPARRNAASEIQRAGRDLLPFRNLQPRRVRRKFWRRCLITPDISPVPQRQTAKQENRQHQKPNLAPEFRFHAPQFPSNVIWLLGAGARSWHKVIPIPYCLSLHLPARTKKLRVPAPQFAMQNFP